MIGEKGAPESTTHTHTHRVTWSSLEENYVARSQHTSGKWNPQPPTVRSRILKILTRGPEVWVLRTGPGPLTQRVWVP